MRKRLFGLAVVLAVLLRPGAAQGETGSTWSVTISNPTSFHVSFRVFYGIGDSISMRKASEAVGLGPGATQTFQVPGAYCPAGLGGMITHPTNHDGYLMKETNCLGNYSDVFSDCCWNLSFRVCRREGEGNLWHDGDWAFCK